MYSRFAQILVKVRNDAKVMADVLSIEALNDEFNMETYNKTVELMNGQYSNLFIWNDNIISPNIYIISNYVSYES